MAMIADADRATIKDLFDKSFVNDVKLVVFTQEFECQYCKETRELAEELASIHDKLSVEAYNFVTDKEQVEKYGVDKIGVFGSYARGTADEKSDIDLYVEFREKTVDNLLGLMVYLNEIFHQKIDLIHKHKYNNKVLIKHIKDEVVYG